MNTTGGLTFHSNQVPQMNFTQKQYNVYIDIKDVHCIAMNSVAVYCMLNKHPRFLFVG